MTLEHEHHHSVRLQPFQQDAFAGDWVTGAGEGARDFNIMLLQVPPDGARCGQSSLQGRLRHRDSRRGSVRRVMRRRQVVVAVYGVDGAVSASRSSTDDTWSIETGDALLWNVGSGEAAEERETVQQGREHTVHTSCWRPYGMTGAP